jgi:very-short-patch-repair endonuclease
MGILFNRFSDNSKRKELRLNMPKAEVVLWSRLKGKQLKGLKFRRQYGVGPYVVDFCCPELKLVIEVDGGSHFEPGARERTRSVSLGLASLDFGFFGLRMRRFMGIWRGLWGGLGKGWRGRGEI